MVSDHNNAARLDSGGSGYVPEIPSELAEQLRHPGESFSAMLLRKIEERGMTCAECYRRAHIGRQQLYKLRNKPNYHPNKITAIAFALALELDWDETMALLDTAGYTLTYSSRFDIIVMYFIRHNIYDVFVINEVLHCYHQKLINTE